MIFFLELQMYLTCVPWQLFYRSEKYQPLIKGQNVRDLIVTATLHSHCSPLTSDATYIMRNESL